MDRTRSPQCSYQLPKAASSRPSVVSDAMDINRDLSCIRVMNLDTSPSSNQGPGITTAPSDSQATHLSHFTSLASSDMPLSTEYEPSSHSLPCHTVHVLTITTIPQGAAWARIFSLEPACGSPWPTQCIMVLGRSLLPHHKQMAVVPNHPFWCRSL